MLKIPFVTWIANAAAALIPDFRGWENKTL